MEHGRIIISLVLDTVFVLSLPGLVLAVLAAVLYSGITLSLQPAKNSCDFLGRLAALLSLY